MKPKGTLLLTRRDVAALLGLDECIAVVEQVFKSHAEGRSISPGVLGIHTRDGGFHIKAAGLELARPYFAAKVNGNFFQNKQRFGMPNIQGIIALCDAENGYPLAVMDSIEITIIRTGAATGVAAKCLQRTEHRRDSHSRFGRSRWQERHLRDLHAVETALPESIGCGARRIHRCG